MAHLDRRRAEALMDDMGIDALVLLSPESFLYATSVPAGVATMWREAGAVAVLVPADAKLSEMAVVSDLFAESFRRQSHIADVRQSPIWVETTNFGGADPVLGVEEMVAAAWRAEGRESGFARPTTFDPKICFQHLFEALRDRGLSAGRIGIETNAVSARNYPDLQSALVGFKVVDASELVARLKMVKSPAEINFLRQAVTMAESGILAVKDAISEGVKRNELAHAWTKALEYNPDDYKIDGSWEYISVGPDPWGGNASAMRGDLIKVDVGCLVEGYTSDTGRTFVLGTPTSQQARLYAALMKGFVAGSDLLLPGIPLREVHRATLAAIRSSGFPGYSRGHFGHGLGAGLGSEEWPFISADSGVLIEPGMVLAFECPWYINGLGGFIIENQILITDKGPEVMNSLPIELIEVST